jgi:hypothetical protein
VHVQAGHQNPYFAAPPKPTDPSGLTYTPPSELRNQTLRHAVIRSLLHATDPKHNVCMDQVGGSYRLSDVIKMVFWLP